MMMIRVVELWSRRTKSMHIDMVLVCFAAQRDISQGLRFNRYRSQRCVRVCTWCVASPWSVMGMPSVCRAGGGVVSPADLTKAPLVAWSCDGFNPIPAERQVQPSVTVSPQPSPAGELLVLWARPARLANTGWVQGLSIIAV